MRNSSPPPQRARPSLLKARSAARFHSRVPWVYPINSGRRVPPGSPLRMRDVTLCFFVMAAMALAQLPPAAGRRIDFRNDIEPIFRANCVACHGPAAQQSGFRLDDRVSLLKGGNSGKPAVVPGNSEISLLVQRVAGMPGVIAMPPVGQKLSREQIGLLRAWIDQGVSWNAAPPASAATAAPVSKHWSFQPIVKPPVPGSDPHRVDAFVRDRLRKESIASSPEAPRNVLLRRLSLDLIGLPPTPAELADFLADSRPDAYERQVDRLLASPHYGEKWAPPSLHQPRYPHSHGYQKAW